MGGISKSLDFEFERFSGVRYRVRMPGGFEDQPATKRDLAGVKEELVEKIEGAESSLRNDITHLEAKIEKGFDRLAEYFKGPHGFIERLEKVEERIGLR